MILRSITKHVKEQNWFAIFLDLIIVVFGVFIGLQVSNFNDEQVGVEKAKVLVSRMNEDLNNDLDVLTAMMNYHKVVRKYAITALDGFNGLETVNDEQFLISSYQASQVNITWTHRVTFDELVSTGQINLIKSDLLKRKILSHYARDWSKDSLLVELAPYRKAIRRLIPFVIQNAVRTNCGDVNLYLNSGISVELPSSCDLALPDALFTASAKKLRLKGDILLDLQYQIAVMDTQVETLISLEIQTQNLIATIKELQ